MGRVQRTLGVASIVVVSSAGCSDDGVPADETPGSGSEGAGATSGSTIADPTSASPTSSDGGAGDAESGGDPGASSDGDSTGANAEGSPGCGSPYVGDPVVSGQIDVAGEPRTFVLSVPAGYDPEVPTTLVFAWHGLGGNGELARLYFNVEEASAGQAIFVYPDALPQASSGGQTGWELINDGSDLQFFDTLFAELTNNLCVAPERVFSTGHSFGGYMSNALGCFRADVLRAIAPVAGGPPFQGCQSERVAAWMAHGTVDAVVPFAQGELARDLVTDRNGCGTETVATPPEPCAAFEGCDADYPVTWCAHDLSDGDGHAWPPFAADAIWAFFDGLPVPANP